MSYPIFQTKHTAAHSISIGTFLNFKNSLFQHIININIEMMMMDIIALPAIPTVRLIYTNGELDLVGGLEVGVRVRVDKEIISAKCEKQK